MNPSALIRRPVAAPARAEAANDPVLTMSSRDIAKLLGCRHDNVKTTVERLVVRGVIESPAMQEIPTATRPATVYLIGKRDSYVIVAQLSPEFTARLVDRWQELESAVVAPRAPVELSRMEILQLAMDAEQGRLAAEAKVAVMAPQVEALHRIALSATDSTLCLTDAAKHLQLAPKRFITWLLGNGWLFRRTEGSNLAAMQPKLDALYLAHKVVEFEGSGGVGDKRQAKQVRVTQKGLVKLAHLIAKGKGPAA